MRVGVSSDHVKNVIIWGNHSSTQYPDVHHAIVNRHGKEVSGYEAVNDESWLKGDFISVSLTSEPVELLKWDNQAVFAKNNQMKHNSPFANLIPFLNEIKITDFNVLKGKNKKMTCHICPWQGL